MKMKISMKIKNSLIRHYSINAFQHYRIKNIHSFTH